MKISNHLIVILQEKPELKPRTTLNGTQYGFIPNLDKEMTVGEWTDLDVFMRDWKDFHKAMAVLYRPIVTSGKNNYLIEKYTGEEDRDAMKEITMDVVMGAVVFFWTLSDQLLRITPKYLQRHLQKNPEVAAALEKNGVGISTLLNSLEEASLKLQTLLPYTWVQRYSF